MVLLKQALCSLRAPCGPTQTVSVPRCGYLGLSHWLLGLTTNNCIQSVFGVESKPPAWAGAVMMWAIEVTCTYPCYPTVWKKWVQTRVDEAKAIAEANGMDPEDQLDTLTLNAATREGLGLMEEVRDFWPLLMDLDDLNGLMKQKNRDQPTLLQHSGAGEPGEGDEGVPGGEAQEAFLCKIKTESGITGVDPVSAPVEIHDGLGSKLSIVNDDKGMAHVGCYGRIAGQPDARTSKIVGAATGPMLSSTTTVWTTCWQQDVAKDRRNFEPRHGVQREPEVSRLQQRAD